MPLTRHAAALMAITTFLSCAGCIGLKFRQAAITQMTAPATGTRGQMVPVGLKYFLGSAHGEVFVNVVVDNERRTAIFSAVEREAVSAIPMPVPAMPVSGDVQAAFVPGQPGVYRLSVESGSATAEVTITE